MVVPEQTKGVSSLDNGRLQHRLSMLNGQMQDQGTTKNIISDALRARQGKQSPRPAPLLIGDISAEPQLCSPRSPSVLKSQCNSPLTKAGSFRSRHANLGLQVPQASEQQTVYSPSSPSRKTQASSPKRLAQQPGSVQLPASPVNTAPPLLPIDDSLDEETRSLFKEVQQLSELGNVSTDLAQKYDLRALYARCSHRLDSLPCALVTSMNQQLRIMPLPASRGTMGYTIGPRGQIRKNPYSMGPYLAASSGAQALVQELKAYEAACQPPEQGLESDPELVRLWRDLGGSCMRHATPDTKAVISLDDSIAQETVQEIPKIRQFSRANSGVKTPTPGTVTAPVSQPTTARTLGSRQNSAKPLQRRKSWRLSSHPVTNVNSISGQPMGYYRKFVQDIQSLKQPQQLSPELHVGFSPRDLARARSPNSPQQRRSPTLQQGNADSDTDPAAWAEFDTSSTSSDESDSKGTVEAARSSSQGFSLQTASCQLGDGGASQANDLTAERSSMSKRTNYNSARNPFGGSMQEDEPRLSFRERQRPSSSSIAVTEACTRSDQLQGAAVAVAAEPETDDLDTGHEGSTAQPDASMETAWLLVQDALSRGRRTKVRRRDPWGTKSSQRKPTVKLTEPPKATPRRCTESGGITPRETSGKPTTERSMRAAASLVVRGNVGPGSGNSRSSHVVEHQQALSPGAAEVVDAFANAWTQGTEVGDMQVMSLARLKEVMLESTSSPQQGNGSVAMCCDTRMWGSDMKPWLPTHDEQKQDSKLRASPTRTVHLQQPPAHLAADWLPAGVLERAQRPGSTLKPPGPPIVAAPIETSRRHEQLWSDPADEAEVGKVGLNCQALHRRISQLKETRQPLLDLDLAHHLGRVEMGVVYQAVLAAPHIKGIKATHGLLNKSGVQGLVQLLKACRTIQELDISHTPAICPEAADLLGDVLHPRHHLHLHTLKLEGCPIQDEGFHSIALGLQFNSQLTSLHLGGTGLTDTGLKALDHCLEQNVMLSHLDLSDNRFSVKGIEYLTKDLKRNLGMKELRLKGCRLDDASATALAGLLTTLPSLQLLDLSCNNIGSQGAAALGDALGRLETTWTTQQTAVQTLSTAMATDAVPAMADSQSTTAPSACSSPRSARHNSVTGRALASESSAVGSGPGNESETSTTPRVNTTNRQTATAGQVCSSLHTLLLDSNPFGTAGIVYLFKGLNKLSGQECSLNCITLDNTGDHPAVPHTPGDTLPYWDIERPNGLHTLDLSVPQHREAAATLVKLATSSHLAWITAQVDGVPVAGTKLPPTSWHKQLPETGTLQVKVLRKSVLPAGSAVLSPLLEQIVAAQLGRPASDHVKLQFIACVSNVAAVSARQAARMISYIEYSAARVEVARELLSCCVDPCQFLPALLQSGTQAVERSTALCKGEPAMSSEDVTLLLNDEAIRAYQYTPGAIPVTSWAQLAAPGRYTLDMSQQVHHVVACCAIAVVAQQQGMRYHYPPSSAQPVADQQQCNEDAILSTWGKSAHTGQAASLLRNVQHQGHGPLYPAEVNLNDLPRSGTLSFDLLLSSQMAHVAVEQVEPPKLSIMPSTRQQSLASVNMAYNSPTTTNELTRLPEETSRVSITSNIGTPDSIPQAGTVCSSPGPAVLQRTRTMSLSGSRAAQSSSRFSAATTVAALTPAEVCIQRLRARQLGQGLRWEQLYQKCLQLLGLEMNDVRLVGWKQAASTWGGPDYEHAVSVWRSASIKSYTEAIQAGCSASQQSTGNDAPGPNSQLTGGVEKKKPSKVSAKAAAKAAKEAAKVAEAAAACLAVKQSKALAGGVTALRWMLEYARDNKLTSLQVMYLLQLLPDMDQRLALLAAVLPALHDRQHCIDVILCMNCNTPLPANTPADSNPAATAGNALHTITSLQQCASGSTESDLWMTPRVTEVLKKPASGEQYTAGSRTNSIKSDSSQPRKTAAPGKGTNKSTKAPPTVTEKPTNDKPASVPSNALPQSGTVEPILLSLVLQLAVERVGWGSLNLRWSHPEAVKAVMDLGFTTATVTEGCTPGDTEGQPNTERLGLMRLNLNDVEQLQTAIKLCKWCDLARLGGPETPVLGDVMTDAGELALEHEGSWSYWEQLLGWLCARTTHSDGTSTEATQRLGTLPQLDFQRLPAAMLPPEATTGSDVPLGKLHLRFNITLESQRHAAAALIQSTWRGWRARQGMAAALRAEALEGQCPVGKRRTGVIAALMNALLPRSPSAIHAERALAALLAEQAAEAARMKEAAEAEGSIEWAQPLTPVFAAVNEPKPERSSGEQEGLPQRRSVLGSGGLRGQKSARFGELSRRPSKQPGSSSLRRCSVFGDGPADAALPLPQAQLQPLPALQIPLSDEEQHAIWARAVHRWQCAWAVLKFWKRVGTMQRLAGPMSVAHAQCELHANADHLFPPT